MHGSYDPGGGAGQGRLQAQELPRWYNDMLINAAIKASNKQSGVGTQNQKSCGFLCGLGQRIKNGFTGNGFKTDKQIDELHDFVTHQMTVVEIDPFTNTVGQAGASWGYGGIGLSYVPSTGNVYINPSVGTKGGGIFLGAGPTTNLDQSGKSVGFSGFYGLGGGTSWNPYTGDRTDLIGFGTPNWSLGGGESWQIFSLPPAKMDVMLPGIPPSAAIPIGEGLYTYGGGFP
jgi:hypothetical protein